MGNGKTDGNAGFSLEETADQLNEAYEIMEGASAILGMLYERLQESPVEESVEMAGVVHVVRRSLGEGARMVGKADEALDGLEDGQPIAAGKDGR